MFATVASIRLPHHANAAQGPFLTLNIRFYTKIDTLRCNGGRPVVPTEHTQAQALTFDFVYLNIATRFGR
jgi:hypothetical protein